MAVVRTVELFANADEHLTFEAGEVIFKSGTFGHMMYGIVSGTVDLQVDGKTVETIEAGDVFGEGALVQTDHTRATTAIAQTDCQLIAVSESRFKFLIENTPMFAIEVLQSFSNRLQRFKHPQAA
ncbi:Crp/Fnr family transcriptional regulator [Leptolyngbya iicbica]|nr:cyclic nucleotide-binding domain-containing protein [Leptolyngbya sp. LK]